MDIISISTSGNLTVAEDNSARLSDVYAMWLGNQAEVGDLAKLQNESKQSIGVLTSEE